MELLILQKKVLHKVVSVCESMRLLWRRGSKYEDLVKCESPG